MRDVVQQLIRWWREGESVAVATVVATFKSAPMPPGASLLVGPNGRAVGSVSGGCVEGSVYEEAQAVLTSGTPVLRRYGLSDEAAFEAGLTCGGVLDVFTHRFDQASVPEFETIADDIENDRPVALIILIEHPDGQGKRCILRPDGRVEGSLGHPRLDQAVQDDAAGLLAAGHSGVLTYGPEGQRRGEGARAFVWVFAPRPRMIVFGAIDFAAAVARMGSFLGYRVTVCDARGVFATSERFPDADEVIVEWPHRYLTRQADEGSIDQRTVLCVLTHDPKFDAPLLEVALTLDVAYVGAMGSRRTHADRIARLRDAGLNSQDLSRMSSPIGLDLGARTPEETAVAIAAEIIALRWGGGGQRLSTTDGRIHH